MQKQIKNRRRFRIYSALTALFSLSLLVGILASHFNIGNNILSGIATKNTADYSITLNSSNKVTSAGDHVQKTARGSNVTFTYSNIANSTTGHTTLNSGGTLVNKD